MTTTREETLQAERDAAALADAVRKARDEALEQAEKALNALGVSAQTEVDRSAAGEHRAYWNGQVTAHIKGMNAIRALRSKPTEGA